MEKVVAPGLVDRTSDHCENLETLEKNDKLS